MDSQRQLIRRLGLGRGISLAFSLIIGSGLLGLPGMTIQHWGPLLPLAGWLFTLGFVLPLIFVFTELGIRYPVADGLTLYGEIAFGRAGKFILTYLLAGSFCLGVPFIGIVGASYLQQAAGLPPAVVPWIAVAAFWLVTGLNLCGVKLSAGLNHVAFLCLFGLLVAIVGFNGHHLWRGLQASLELSPRALFEQRQDLRECSLVLFWAFIGWEELSFALEEFHDPKRTIPRVYWISFFLVCVCYLALAFTASGAELNGVRMTGTNSLSVLLPTQRFSMGFTAAICFVALANANSNVFAYSRLVFAAGRDGVMPRALGRLSKRAIPYVSLVSLTTIYTFVIVTVVGLDIPWSRLVSLVDHGFVLLYFITVVAFFKQVKGVRRYWIGIPGLFSCAYFLVVEPGRFAYSAFLVLLGLLAYWKSASPIATSGVPAKN